MTRKPRKYTSKPREKRVLQLNKVGIPIEKDRPAREFRYNEPKDY